MLFSNFYFVAAHMRISRFLVKAPILFHEFLKNKIIFERAWDPRVEVDELRPVHDAVLVRIDVAHKLHEDLIFASSRLPVLVHRIYIKFLRELCSGHRVVTVWNHTPNFIDSPEARMNKRAHNPWREVFNVDATIIALVKEFEYSTEFLLW